LEALHDRLIVYRDLKPENIMLDGHGYAKLIDLGTAKKLEKASARTYTITGTVVYISPEAIRGRGYGMEADFWALGVLAFQLSVGRDPFGHGETEDKLILEQILSEELVFPEWYKDAEGRRLISGLLCKQPWERLGSSATSWEEVKAHAFFSLGEGAGPEALFGGIAGRGIDPPLAPGEDCFPNEEDVKEEADILGVPLGDPSELECFDEAQEESPTAAGGGPAARPAPDKAEVKKEAQPSEGTDKPKGGKVKDGK